MKAPSKLIDGQRDAVSVDGRQCRVTYRGGKPCRVECRVHAYGKPGWRTVQLSGPTAVKAIAAAAAMAPFLARCRESGRRAAPGTPNPAAPGSEVARQWQLGHDEAAKP